MPEQPRRNARRQKIEPLNYAEAALAPALKGMTSFLDLKPEDVRKGHFAGLVPASLPSPSEQADIPADMRGLTPPGDETAPIYERSLGNDSAKKNGHTNVREISIKSQSSKKDGDISVKPPGGETTPGGYTISNEDDIKLWHRDLMRPPKSHLNDSPTDRDSSPEVNIPSGIETRPGGETYSGYDSPPNFSSAQSRVASNGLTPGRGRSKIKRCVLAQDGHSLGEEAIYQVLWRAGKPENGDPNGSRTIRIGAAELGYKVNMAKKNVRQNISRLFEKLALEIIENFETVNSQARLYRVFSYKQILERRRAAGMEHVLRNKGVVFCSPNGAEILSSPAYVSSPGAKTTIRPAPPKKRRSSPVVVEPPKYPEMTTHLESGQGADEVDLQIVVDALNRYWTVDQAAAVQLLRDCRRVRADAQANEIAFFVQEKLELARTNRNITNPTGLILATVPQSFVGSSFDEFRRRLERQAKLAAEEEERRQKQREEITAWLLQERERLESIVSDLSKSQKERDYAEKRLREYVSRNL